MQAEQPSLAQERIRRFERLGGVDLSRLVPEERRPLITKVEVGMAHVKRAIFTFRCPICGNVERSDQELSPACTGPSWLDEHPLEPMEMITQ